MARNNIRQNCCTTTDRDIGYQLIINVQDFYYDTYTFNTVTYKINVFRLNLYHVRNSPATPERKANVKATSRHGFLYYPVYLPHQSEK